MTPQTLVKQINCNKSNQRKKQKNIEDTKVNIWNVQTGTNKQKSRVQQNEKEKKNSFLIYNFWWSFKNIYSKKKCNYNS